MAALSFEAAPVPVRDDIEAALPPVWANIGKPGTWLTAERRVAIAAESRNATHCTLCAERKEALSPFAVTGEHDSLGDLPENWVEVIHRVMTDSGRLMESWYQEVIASGITEGEYVEMIGVIVCTVGIDTFHRGIGMAPPALPDPQPGEPSRYTPSGLERELAYVPMIDPERIAAEDADLYAGAPAAHIRRALTSVPDTARDFWRMANVLYMASHEMRDFANEYRAITHAQIELVAGRVSAINQCVY